MAVFSRVEVKKAFKSKRFYEISKIVRKFVCKSKVQKYENFSNLEKIYPINNQKNISTTPADYFDGGQDNLLERLFPQNPESSRFLILCRRSDYSAGRIARAIEDCNAHVLNLNVTADTLSDDMIAVDVRVNRNDISAISRSLSRYDYMVVGVGADSTLVSDTERERVAELLRYLDM